jgi:pimeloyl-ACP methyl ester carboxylesterase
VGTTPIRAEQDPDRRTAASGAGAAGSGRGRFAAEAAPEGRSDGSVPRPRGGQPVPGPAVTAPGPTRVAAPRLSRHTFMLSDGHRIGLAVSGRGVPLVVVHGFTAEGFLYAQTLHRLVGKGFKVIAIDMAGHGNTQGLPGTAGHLADYARLMGRALDELGIRKAVLAGHSMGGRVVAQLAADEPDKAIAILLIDAILGDEWDLLVKVFRLNPLLLAGLAAGLAIDTVSTVPLLRDPGQAMKLARLAIPTVFGHVAAPWRLLGPGISILRTSSSRTLLDELARTRVPTFVLHGNRDVMIPYATARSAAARAGGQLVTVEGATHSWLLKDPETLPAIVSELLEDRLGDAIRKAITAAGARSVDQLEDIFYAESAPILALSPALHYEQLDDTHRRPRYRWTIT